MAATLFTRLTTRTAKTWSWLQGWFHAYVTLSLHRLFRIPIRNLTFFERRVAFIERWEYSQNGEDGILNAIFAMIGTTNKQYVEFGVEDGMQANTRFLWKHRGWHGLLMDGDYENNVINLHKEFVTAENVEELFRKYDVKEELDLLSIDVDGNDYWIWKAITNFRPRVVVCEYNACFPWEASQTVPYEPTFNWDHTRYFGVTLKALVSLSKEKGYTLVATDTTGTNAFFVRDDLTDGAFVRQNPETLYHPAAYKGKKGNMHPADPHNRPWVTIS